MKGLIKDHPVSEVCVSQWKLATAIVRLWARDEGHSHLGGANQIRGNSISVGIRIFSIGAGLSFVGGLCRVFGLSPPGGLTLR